MSDTTVQPPETLKERIFAFVTGPQGQSIIRRALSGSGVVGVWLVNHSFPEADLGTVADFLIVVLPFVLTEIWGQFSKTKAAIITQAAKIVADKQGQPMAPEVAKAAEPLVNAVASMPGIQVQVDKTAPAGAQAAAADPKLLNVNPV